MHLRENLDEDLMRKELEALGLPGIVVNITNPWYCREKGAETWIKIGESDDKHENFPIRWDTTSLRNGRYEIMGLMHVFVKKDNVEGAMARESIVEVVVEN